MSTSVSPPSLSPDRLSSERLRDIEARLARDGRVEVLEVNVSPGLTETSLLPRAIEAAGLDLGEVFGLLVERAVRRSPERSA